MRVKYNTVARAGVIMARNSVRDFTAEQSSAMESISRKFKTFLGRDGSVEFGYSKFCVYE